MLGRRRTHVARYRLLALLSVVGTALLGTGALAWFVAGGLTGPTLVVLGLVAAFVVLLAGAGLRGTRRTSTPYW